MNPPYLLSKIPIQITLSWYSGILREQCQCVCYGEEEKTQPTFKFSSGIEDLPFLHFGFLTREKSSSWSSPGSKPEDVRLTNMWHTSILTLYCLLTVHELSVCLKGFTNCHHVLSCRTVLTYWSSSQYSTIPHTIMREAGRVDRRMLNIAGKWSNIIWG